jgi:signal-transduction protein with cAMP-binding, CBS, and nucleotidyltransferase domain
MLALRDRSKKKDTQLRKKAAKELNRSKMVVGQVAKLPTGSTLHQAAQLMAAQRADAVLVVSPGNSDTPGKLLGILTDRDIVNRAVAIGVSITVPITQVMTRDPVAVPRSTPFGEALQLMIARKFRHLPMVDSMNGEPQSPVGILDIAQCVLSRLADLEKKVQEDSSVRQAMEVLRRNGDLPHDVATMLAARHSCPTIKEIIRDSTIPEVSVRVSVKEAAQVMKLNHSTGVLVMSSDHGVDSLAGILTTKDIVLRVLAADLDPNTTSVVRVMVTKECSFILIDSST